MVVPQDRLRHLAIAGWTSAFLGCVFVDRKPGRIDPEFNKLTGTHMPLNDIGRDVKVLGILGVHSNAIHQLVVVGKLLGAEFLLKATGHACL